MHVPNPKYGRRFFEAFLADYGAASCGKRPIGPRHAGGVAELAHRDWPAFRLEFRVRADVAARSGADPAALGVVAALRVGRRVAAPAAATWSVAALPRQQPSAHASGLAAARTGQLPQRNTWLAVGNGEAAPGRGGAGYGGGGAECRDQQDRFRQVCGSFKVRSIGEKCNVKH